MKIRLVQIIAVTVCVCLIGILITAVGNLIILAQRNSLPHEIRDFSAPLEGGR